MTSRQPKSLASALICLGLTFTSVCPASYCVLDLVSKIPSAGVVEAIEKQARTRMWMNWFPDDRYIRVFPKTYFSPKFRMFTISGEENVKAFLDRLEGGLNKIESYANSSIAGWAAGGFSLGAGACYLAGKHDMAMCLAAVATMALMTKIAKSLSPDPMWTELLFLRNQFPHFRYIASGAKGNAIANHAMKLPEDKGEISLFLAVRRLEQQSQLLVLTPID